ncbi:hypothetical protein GFS31_36740 [Leptolyngbya sp. BL0902]|nr:hypothetical protein GFS31_36740 [Leptolyngbya sp. BL0902]
MIGLLISLLLGGVIGFYLRQGQVAKLAATLKASQERESRLQQEHDTRLRAATAQLQQDYAAQLADNIEHYQRQYEAQRQQLEAEYEARQNLMPGGEPPNPNADPGEGWETAPASEYEVRLRQQYEARLKEAAQKIQHAYEQHLRETLANEREAQQQEYDQRLAEAIARAQDEAEARLAAALTEQEAMAQIGGAGLATGWVDETQVQEQLATLEAELRSSYDRRLAERIEQYQDEMSQRIAQMEQEFAARLQMAQANQPAEEPPQIAELPATADLEARFQAEYNQRLAAAVARHQDELTERLQALTEEYEARLHGAKGGNEAGEVDAAALETALRQEIEAELRAEYDLQLAEKLEQFQADFGQRAQDFEAGLIATLDPFEDAAIQAESLEDEGFEADPFPDFDAFQAATLAEDAPPTLGEPAQFADAAVPPEATAAQASANRWEVEEEAITEEDWSQDEAGTAAREDTDEDDFGLGEPPWEGAGVVDTDLDLELGDADPDAVAFDTLDAAAFNTSDLSDLSEFDGADSGADGGADLAALETPLHEDEAALDFDADFNLDDLALSVIPNDETPDQEDEEDIFNLEVLAQRAGVDLNELNNLLNQTDRPPTTEDDISDFSEEDWGNLS